MAFLFLKKKMYVRGAMIVITLAACIIAAQHYQARPDVRAFDPRQMGRLETGMWRSYYEGRWIRLGWQTMQIACGQYRFSWWDGSQLAWHAAISAMYFRQNTDDPRCLGELASYYRIVQHGAASPFAAKELARLELQWWQERRQDIPPQGYAHTMARLTALLYGISEEKALPTASLRAGAMAYRDARRDGKMHDADWIEVERQLTEAYSALKRGIE